MKSNTAPTFPTFTPDEQKALEYLQALLLSVEVQRDHLAAAVEAASRKDFITAGEHFDRAYEEAEKDLESAIDREAKN